MFGQELSPDFFSNFLYQRKLCPLVFFGQLIADLTGRKSALRAEAETIQRNVLCSLMDSVDNGLLVLQFRLFRSNQTQHYLFIGRNLCKRFKTAASLIIVFQQQCVYIFLCENIVCNRIIRAACK